MKVLAIDGSGNAASVAILEDDKLITEYMVNYKLTHSQTLMPMIDEICQMVDVDLSTIDAIGVTSGPGSFTGLRISAGTAKGLALALDIPIVGISTLDAMANNIPYTDYVLCPIMDARRGQVYTAFYEQKDVNLERLTEHMVIPIEEVIQIATSFQRQVIFLGDGVEVHKEKIQDEMGERAKFAPPSLRLQSASVVAELAMVKAKNGEVVSHMDFAPTYLRLSQAEREYEERNQKK